MTLLNVIFLGTSASVPTRSRSLSSIAIQRGGELILFDCGEGAQRNLLQTGIGLNRKTRLLISHLHADHISGILGLIQTMSMLGRNKKLEIYGPKGTKKFIEAILTTTHSRQTFPIEVFEHEGGLVYAEREYEVRSVPVSHLDVVNFAYALIEFERPGKFDEERARELGIPKGPLWGKLQRGRSIKLGDKIINPSDVLGPPRKGRKIVYSGDCIFSEELVELANGADLLIHDSTFSDRLRDRAMKTGHSTAGQAARIAKKAGVKMLALTHISARYRRPIALLRQARKIFKNTIIARDLMQIKIPYPE